MTTEASPGCEVARRDRLIAVSGQADLDSFGQVAHPADTRAQVIAVVGRIRERLEKVGAELFDLAKLVVFHVPETTRPGPLIRMDAWAIEGGDPSMTGSSNDRFEVPEREHARRCAGRSRTRVS